MNNMDIRLRKASLDDLDDINHVIEAGVMIWDLPARVKRLSLASYTYDAIDLQHLQIYIAEADRQCVAVIALDPEHITIDNNLLIHGIYVHPEKQGKGIGKFLIEAVENIARTLSASGLLVKAQKDAVGFFTATGMVKLPAHNKKRDYPLRYWKSVV
jgi:N-acetylglutamate synthase-like GNAT family acetyltransferase